jgi:hypothetical protein
MAPGDVPVMKAGLFGHTLLPYGRVPQSIAFFNTAGIDTVMLRRHDQYAVGTSDIVLVAHDLRREIGLEVLVEHWQVVDTNEFSFEFVAGEFHKSVGELSIDRLASVPMPREIETARASGFTGALREFYRFPRSARAILEYWLPLWR